MGTSASAVEETPLLAKTNKNGADNTNTETLDDAGEDAKEFYEDGAPLNRRYAMTHKKPGEGASTRSVKRMRRNILLLVLLSVVFVLLVSLCYVEYRRIQAPKRKAHAIEVKIKEHAAAAAIRFEQCHNTDWQTACDKLANAGARRQRNLQEQEKNGIYNTINTETVEQHRHHKRRHPGIDYETSLLMDHDEIAVTYDNNCLRVYRLSMFDDTITFPYYANQLLRAGGNYTMALFIQHGALRNAPDYFCSFKKLMRQQMYRPFEEILIIAPDFNYGKDALVHPNDAIWNSTKPWGDWRVGAESDPKCCGTSGRTVSSFDVLDHMLTLLMDQSLYPKLKKISFLGHSAGGQMVQRYSLLSILAALWDNDDSIETKFIVANPSSYTYLGPHRYPYACGHCDCSTNECACDADCATWSKNSTRKRRRRPQLGIPHHGTVGSHWPCYSVHYDRWPYGIGALKDESGHSVPYSMRDGMIGTARAVRLYRRLHVVYMVGQNDTCNNNLPNCDDSCWKRTNYDPIAEGKCFRNDMDTRCPAMLQGPNRRARAHRYMQYLEWFYGKPTHNLYTVPGVGHNATGMFSSDIGLRELFE